MSGMDVLGREHYGVLSLMGKVENVRDSDVKDSVSPIIQNIMNALGLDFEACYKTGYKLRYGHVMFMMDQDADGIHTKGLLLNIFGKYWPSLLKIDRFLSDFTTLLVKKLKMVVPKKYSTRWKVSIDLMLKETSILGTLRTLRAWDL